MIDIRINLLPYREQQRAAQQKAFAIVAAGVAVAALLIVLGGHMMIARWKDEQAARNNLLKTEIAKLDTQIKEIAQLKDKINSLLARKRVVESLQGNRAESVHLFDELARKMPEGVYLKGLKQAGSQLTLQGFAQSGARVSTLMRNLDGSLWLDGAKLVEVKSASVNGQRAQEFNVIVKQSQPKPDDADSGGKAGKP